MDQAIQLFLMLQFAIFLPFLAGMWLRPRLSNPREFARKVTRWDLILLEPWITFWVLWGLELELSLIALPIAGLTMVSAGFGLGWLLQNFINQSAQKSSRATFIISSSLSNHGYALGGFLCYLLLAEQGLAYSIIYILYFYPFTFIIIFSFANRFSPGNEFGSGWKAFFNNFISLQYLPLYGSIAGMWLAYSEIERPDIEIPLRPLIMLSVGMYFLALGLNFSWTGVRKHRRTALFINMIKFIILPALAGIGILFWDGPQKIITVIVLEAFMPAAVYSVIASVIYRLDEELAATLFVTSQLSFYFLILPLLMLVYFYIL